MVCTKTLSILIAMHSRIVLPILVISTHTLMPYFPCQPANEYCFSSDQDAYDFDNRLDNINLYNDSILISDVLVWC